MSTEKTDKINLMVSRLNLIIERTEKTKKAFAKRLGYDASLFTKIAKGDSALSERLINSIISVFGIRREWWENGDGDMFQDGQKAYGTVGKDLTEIYKTSDGVLVGVFALAGAGAPTDLVTTEPLEMITIPKFFFKPSITTIKVRGKSMEPLIRDGAYVGVDREDKWIVSGEIYAVWLPYEGAVIKRIYLDMEKITLKSDNMQFPEMSVSLTGLNESFIQGRVKWVIQML